MTDGTERFEAKLMVQGVGNYVPHLDRKRLVVLFPNQDTAERRGIRAFNGEKICRHYAFLQFNLRNLDDSLPDRRASVDVSDHWVGLASDSEVPLTLGSELEVVPGVPNLSEVLRNSGLEKFAAIDPRALPGEDFSPGLLRAGLYLDRGVPSPGGDFEGQFTFFDGGLTSRNRMDYESFFANVIEFELGEVSRLAIRLAPFHGGPERAIPLRPAGNQDQLEIWVRHFCGVDEPDPEFEVPEPEEPDADFALTYALCRDLESLLQERGYRLPFPRVSTSWASGGPIGGRPNKCMGGGNPAASFQAVFS